MPNIVVFGATGFTGHLTVEALCQRGQKPRIAGRDRGKLEKLSQANGGLEIAVANIRDPDSIQSALSQGDVMITTVGPFNQFGRPAVEAAIQAKAHYIDSTGEIAFASEVVQKYGDRAAQAGVSLHTAAGYDFVPGICAAAVALKKAGDEARRVDVGYFAQDGAPLRLSQGTRASLADASLSKGVFWKNGKLVNKIPGTRSRKFDLNGRPRPAISISSTEHLFLPRSYPQLKTVNVYLGWFGSKTHLMQALALTSWPLMHVPGVAPGLRKLASRRFKSRGRGPRSGSRAELGSHIVAEAFNTGKAPLARAELTGANGYDFTASMLALLAEKQLNGKLSGTGAVSPVEAFGLDGLVQACAEAGLELKA